MRSARAGWAAALGAAAASLICAQGAFTPARAAPAAEASPAPRVEARSSDLWVVGIVHGDRMVIHVSRLLDNSPVRDAVVTVTLRGATHATVAESDGSYSVATPDLALPGTASIEFLVTQGAMREELKGTLSVAGALAQQGSGGNSRQLGWWVLNFAVCIGFLWLWSRRKSSDS